MEDFVENFSSYDENDIEDFEEYLHYYGLDNDDTNTEDADEEIESDLRELYF